MMKNLFGPIICSLILISGYCEVVNADLSLIYNKTTLVPKFSRSLTIEKTLYWRKHGEIYDRFLGVPAYSNRTDGKYQCTELVHRYLNQIFGIPTKIGIGMGHANIMLQNEYAAFSKKTYDYQKTQKVKMNLLANARASEPPAPGSVINFSIGKAGHVAVVRYVDFLSPDLVKVYLFEQHGYPRHRAGDVSPIVSILFKKLPNNKWSGQTVRGTGRPLYWINFEKVPQ